jgi:uncharacterized protein
LSGDMTMTPQIAIETPASDEHVDLFSKGLSAFTGVGADHDLVEAHKWFNIAAMRGSREAMTRRRELADMMTQSQVAAAQKAAREWLTLAVN